MSGGLRSEFFLLVVLAFSVVAVGRVCFFLRGMVEISERIWLGLRIGWLTFWVCVQTGCTGVGGGGGDVCGPNNGGASCATGSCCSVNGFCGTTDVRSYPCNYSKLSKTDD